MQTTHTHEFPFRTRFAGLALASALLATPAAAQGPFAPLFSIDYHGPTKGIPDSVYGFPITEGDILSSLTALGPLPAPGHVYTGGAPSPTLHNLGLGLYPAAVGLPGGIPGRVEVDAFSLGNDFLLSADQTLIPGNVMFSVDEFAGGVAQNPMLPEVASEGAVGDSSADVFTNTAFIPLPNPIPPVFLGTHIGVIDGDGLASGSGYAYQGLGLIEPNAPWGPPPDFGDNLDALETESADWSALFFSLDASFPDPHPLMGGFPNSASALAHGYVGGDVLMTMPFGAGPLMYAPAPLLGLDFFGPDTDDLDALVLRENGNLVFEPPFQVDQWIFGPPADMVFFSVRRGSAVIGMPDSLRGMPIEEGDILMPPIATFVGGMSPFPAIYVPAETLGLATTRSGSTSAVAPALSFADDLDALDFHGFGQNRLYTAEYCHCATAAPCGNVDPTAGCMNSTGMGGHLTAGGTSSVIADDLVLTVTQIPANEFGLIYTGQAQINVPFGDGRRCVGPGVGGIWRYPVGFSGATGTLTLGPGIVGFAAANFGPAGWITPGSTWNYQGWFRDPAGPCGSSFNLSNGLAVLFTL